MTQPLFIQLVDAAVSGRRCPRCGSKGPFSKNRDSASGLQTYCKQCNKAMAAEFYKKNKAKIVARCAIYREKNPEKYKAYDAKTKAAQPERYMWLRARSRAERKGLPFTIEISDIKIPERCPLLGVVLEYGRGVQSRHSPTLDRKNPKLGYVKGNVWVVSYKANAMKQDASLDELESLVRNLRVELSGGFS